MTDQGLREALERLVAERRSDDGNDLIVFPAELSALLTDHPAAPAVPQPVSTTEDSVVRPVDREALEQRIAEAIDQNYDEDAYLPVYSLEGHIVTSGAARAVLAVLAGGES